ncbi:MAG: tRNA lysidine(34) synthetase TilS [Coriobacteriia bacterium]|nr:tRNA lysidine(34) synthetase TilS [Coriobacteriia bacterium]
MFAGAPVVVAMVSGGADSVALLTLLARGALGGLGGLSVLHVNHQLRGRESDGDEVFVRNLCARLGIECTVISYDVAGHAAEAGLNLEDAGRQLRYGFAADEVDARCDAMGEPRSHGRIAVAHTADDRIETFLARLVSGAGPAGLRSIPPVRERIVRPLIDVRRTDIVRYLEAIGQGWREDTTNADTRRERSWVRHTLLPIIEERNPSFEQAARRTMTVLAGEDTLLQEMADAFARDFSHEETGVLTVDRIALGTLSRPMVRRTLRTAIVRVFPDASRIEFDHIEALAAGLAEDGFARDLPFGLRAEVEYDTLRISCKDSTESTLVPGLLHCPGSLDLADAGTIRVIDSPGAALATGPDRVSIDAECVSWPLVVDGPRMGDRMCPFGLEGTKKLSDLLVDVKVPQRLRRLTPVVRDGERIVWVAGVRLAEECRVTPSTRCVVDIVWDRSGSGTDGLTG